MCEKRWTVGNEYLKNLDCFSEFLNGHDELKPQLAERLKQIREAVERSEFFRVHEVCEEILSKMIQIYSN